jgi:hypothetical protein
MDPKKFPRFSSVPEEYRIVLAEWETVERVLAAKNKFGPGPRTKSARDSKGMLVEQDYQHIGEYTIIQAQEKMAFGQYEGVVILRTHDPEVKKILEDLRISSQDQSLQGPHRKFPRIRLNAIKPLGEIKGYQEYETTLVAPMSMKLVRRAFSLYNQHYAEANRFQRMDRQLTELLEGRDYTLREMVRDGEVHTMIIPSNDPERRAEFDKAMNSGEIPLGNDVYAIFSPVESGQKEPPKKRAVH